MNERLEKLRYSLGLDWGELADKLNISRAMLGFIRSGDRRPSAKLLLRISSLEQKACCHNVATNATNDDWQARALTAEARLQQLYQAANQVCINTDALIVAVKQLKNILTPSSI